MSRETKIGLMVAGSFLLVVGGIVGYKWYFDDRPLELTTAEPGDPEANEPLELDKHKPGFKEPNRFSPLSGLPPIQAPEPPNPNAPNGDVHQGQASLNSEEDQHEADKQLLDALSLAALPLQASLESLRGLTAFLPMDEKAAQTPDTAETERHGAPPPPALASPSPPALEREPGGERSAKPPAEDRKPPAEDRKPQAEDRKPPAEEGKPPPIDEPAPPPGLENRPRLADRVRQQQRPEPPPALKFQPPVESAATARRDTPAAPADFEPASKLPPRRPAISRLPMTHDRAYDPPSLGKPHTGAADSGTAKPQAAQVPNEAPAGRLNPAPAEQHPPGIPVTLQPLPPEALVPAKPQAALQGSSQGVRPRLLPQDAWSNPQAPAAAAPRAADAVMPRVESFDVETFFARPGDSYASISLAKYQTEQYQHALAMFNRERDPSLATVQPGRPVRIPPRDYLERHYGRYLPSAGTPAANRAGMPASNLGAPANARAPRSAASQRPEEFPTHHAPTTPAAAARPLHPQTREISAADSRIEKQYHVRAEDAGRPAPLYDIARRTLGSGERWGEIARLNKDRLRDVNQLQAGMVLRLPADAKVDAAETPP